MVDLMGLNVPVKRITTSVDKGNSNATWCHVRFNDGRQTDWLLTEGNTIIDLLKYLVEEFKDA